MNPSKSTQDVIRCDLCGDAIVQMYCDICHVNLRISRIGEHICDNYDVSNAKREVIVKDTDEIENIISPTYEEVARDIENQIDNLDKETLTTTVAKHREDCLRVINNIVDKMKVEIEEQKIKHMNILKEHLDEIRQIQLRIEKTSLKLNLIEESKDMSLTMEYSSKNKEFISSNFVQKFRRKRFQTKKIKIRESQKEFLEEPELVTTINTGYENHLLSVTCFGDEEIWTRLEEVIRFQDWTPSQICVTSSGDLLVTMYSDDQTQSKVVRYPGSKEK
ncbi:uncharacterized protein LOC134278945 [Saccostrea cucullata]|uniref:uncharacterized protein LOC134278945 n=1 Tax=Saccostrea cuccullata TaxID=36930 RepID=UPI002ECFD4E4